MAYRVNILLNDAAWSAWQKIPRGQRSQVVSQAITKLVEVEQKMRAAKKMDVLRETISAKVSATQITDWTREDRNRSE